MVSLFLRHDQAVYTMASIVALTVALALARGDSVSETNPKHALLLWLAGIAIVLIPAIVVWWSVGALPEMFRQLILFPFTTYRKTSSLPFPRFTVWRSIRETAVVLLFYLPPIVQAIAALYVVRSVISRRFGRREAVLTFLVIWSALFYLQVIVRSDFTHLVITLSPFFLLMAFGWSIVHEKMANYRKTNMALSAVFAILVALFLWILHSFALPDVTRANEQLALDRGGVRIEQAHVVADFVQRLQASVPPDRSMLVLPYQPMFYFLCERRNPTRWNYLWPGDQTAQDHERLIEEAERAPPAIVLLAERRDVAAFAPDIIEYLRERYLWTGDVGDIAIYVRF
jgi:MFS family permease